MSLFFILLGSFMGDELVSVYRGGHGYPVLYHSNGITISKVVNPGQPASLSNRFAVYTMGEGKILVVPLEKMEPSFEAKSPDSDLMPLFSEQHDMEFPFVFSRNALHILKKQEWTSLELPPFLSFSEPGNGITGTYGLRIRFPALVTLPGKGILAYDSKTGLTRVFNANGHQIKQVKLSRRGYPVRNGTKLYWLNIPREGTCSEADLNEPTVMIRSFAIRDLNRYAMVERGQSGFWVISFPVGLKQSLKSWDSGAVELTLTHIKDINGKTSVSGYFLPNAPLNFELTASPSGSPKLGVTPAFNVLPIANTDELIFNLRKQVILVNPIKGIKSGGLTPRGKLLVARKVEDQHIGWNEELDVLVLW